MNRNVIIGIVVVIILILAAMMFMGSDEPAGTADAPATPPGSTETSPPASPAPSN